MTRAARRPEDLVAGAEPAAHGLTPHRTCFCADWGDIQRARRGEL